MADAIHMNTLQPTAPSGALLRAAEKDGMAAIAKLNSELTQIMERAGIETDDIQKLIDLLMSHWTDASEVPLRTYWKALSNFDWYYIHAALKGPRYRDGERNKDTLRDMSHQSPAHTRMWNAFREHYDFPLKEKPKPVLSDFFDQEEIAEAS